MLEKMIQYLPQEPTNPQETYQICHYSRSDMFLCIALTGLFWQVFDVNTIISVVTVGQRKIVWFLVYPSSAGKNST